MSDFKHFSTPYISTIISDARGINNTPTLSWGDKRIKFSPGSLLNKNSNGLHVPLPLSALHRNDIKTTKFAYTIDLRGMEQLDFIPLGQQSDVKIHSIWPHPAFVGDYLPVSREITEQGYQAQWKVSSLASNISQKLNQCALGNCKQLLNTHFGVKEIEPVSVYVQADRSVKYGILFIGLIFIAFFIFEVVKKLAIHAIQYTLVGFSIAVFYLLLISLSEHIAFAAAYSIAAIACISLLFYYLHFVLKGIKDALFFGAMLSILYAVLYVIISAEDFALLMGAILTFITLALVMICTGNIDWYSLVDVNPGNGLKEPIIRKDK
jgi:inner membrane protein